MRILLVVAFAAAVAWVAIDAALVGVAMSIFDSLRDQLGEAAGRRSAGRVFGDILAWWTLVAWALFALVALALCLRAGAGWERGRRWRPLLAAALVLALGAVHGYGQYLVGAVRAAREAAAPETVLGEDEGFQRLHRRSERVFATEALLALLAALALVPAARSAPPADAGSGDDWDA